MGFANVQGSLLYFLKSLKDETPRVLSIPGVQGNRARLLRLRAPVIAVAAATLADKRTPRVVTRREIICNNNKSRGILFSFLFERDVWHLAFDGNDCSTGGSVGVYY